MIQAFQLRDVKGRQTGTQTDRQTDIQIDRQTEGQTDRRTLRVRLTKKLPDFDSRTTRNSVRANLIYSYM